MLTTLYSARVAIEVLGIQIYSFKVITTFHVAKNNYIKLYSMRIISFTTLKHPRIEKSSWNGI